MYEDLWVAVAVAALLALMPALSVIDLQHRIIPNAVMYPALIAFPVYLLVANLAGAPGPPEDGDRGRSRTEGDSS